ncbi:Cof subfamily protein (haloacid dehalogenase superfamily) [Paenibacillus xylanexedens]|uniref:Cof subfamily protein (Haloacid dehalogenase superfamily) n=1 Tax=Paenibacillus xylanexedens TaxID=528191 RepID=A0ABS4S393_PAEXY|nr:Cof subfamily protein (haloacid dehalogenase superfamily) [Paenibacillus xylanexedens]
MNTTTVDKITKKFVLGVDSLKYSTVVLDLDGTLLNSKKEVSKRNVDAVLSCYQKGMRIIFATARPPRAVNWLLPQGLVDIGAFVYYNGAQVICKETKIEINESIPANVTTEILDYCLKCDPQIELTMEVKDEWFSLRELDYMSSMNTQSNPIVKPLKELKQYDATKILLTGNNHNPGLFEKFEGRVNILITDNNKLVQIMPLLASKEMAITKLCELYNVELDSVIVFGDDHNDVGLFKMAGYSIAMGNAIRELKEIADEITVNNDENGVAVSLERFWG